MLHLIIGYGKTMWISGDLKASTVSSPIYISIIVVVQRQLFYHDNQLIIWTLILAYLKKDTPLRYALNDTFLEAFRTNGRELAIQRIRHHKYNPLDDGIVEEMVASLETTKASSFQYIVPLSQLEIVSFLFVFHVITTSY